MKLTLSNALIADTSELTKIKSYSQWRLLTRLSLSIREKKSNSISAFTWTKSSVQKISSSKMVKAYLKSFKASDNYEFECFNPETPDRVLSEIYEYIDSKFAGRTAESTYALTANLKQN